MKAVGVDGLAAIRLPCTEPPGKCTKDCSCRSRSGATVHLAPGDGQRSNRQGLIPSLTLSAFGARIGVPLPRERTSSAYFRGHRSTELVYAKVFCLSLEDA